MIYRAPPPTTAITVFTIIINTIFLVWCYRAFCKLAFRHRRLQPARRAHREMVGLARFYLTLMMRSRPARAAFQSTFDALVDDRNAALVHLSSLIAPEPLDCLAFATENELERELKKRRRRRRRRDILSSSSAKG